MQESDVQKWKLVSNLWPHLPQQLLLLQPQSLLLHLKLLEPHLLLAGVAAAHDASLWALRSHGWGLLHWSTLTDSLVHG
jgi:hypothetical protein